VRVTRRDRHGWNGLALRCGADSGPGVYRPAVILIVTVIAFTPDRRRRAGFS